MHFSDLSREVQFQTLLNLPYRDILNYCETHTDAQRICNDDSFWRMRLQRETNWPIAYLPGETFREKFQIFQTSSEHELNETIGNSILPDLFESIKERNTGTPKIYFAGEFDSNQSKFERASNHLEIGVIANNETIGLALLRLTHYIVDEDIELYYDDLSNLADDELVTVDSIIRYLSEHEQDYAVSFDLTDTFTVDLVSARGDNTITNNIANVDLWTLPRVVQEFDTIL